MDCYNHSCPVRSNHSSNYHNCEHVACPNKYDGSITITSDHTLSDNKLDKMIRGRDNTSNY